MFIRNIPLSKVKSAARTAAAHWYLCQRDFEQGKREEALGYAELALAEMEKGRIIAGSVLVSLVINALKKDIDPAHQEKLAHAIREIDGELARLSNGKVRPTLHLSPLVAALCKDQGRAAPPSHTMFLPVEPIAIVHEPGAESAASILPFEQALEGYRDEFVACVNKLKTTKDMESLREMSAIANSIERRLTPTRASLISGAFSAWASAISQALKAPSSAQLVAVLDQVRAFREWLIKGSTDKTLPEDKWLLSRLLYSLLICKFSKRAAVLISDYGLDEIAVQSAPKDLSVSYAVVEGNWAQAKMAWEDHIGSPSAQSLAKVHDVVGQFAVAAADGNEEITLMVKSLDDLITRLEPTAGAADMQKRSVISSGVAKTLDAIAKMIADRDEGLSAVTALRQDLIGAQSNDVDLTSAIDPAEVVIPAAALLHEVAVDIMAAAVAAEQNDKVAVLSLMRMAMVAASYLNGKIEGIEQLSSVAEKVIELTGSNWGGLSIAYSKLVRAVELFVTHPGASSALLSEVVDAVSSFNEKTRVQSGSALPIDVVTDVEIFEIFLAESTEVCEEASKVLDQVEHSRRFDGEAPALIRRAFHTLKGSATMSGLENIGACAWVIEKSITAFMAEMSVPMAMAPITRSAIAAIKKAIEDLSATQSAAIDVASIDAMVIALNPALAELVVAVDAAPIQEPVAEVVAAEDPQQVVDEVVAVAPMVIQEVVAIVPQSVPRSVFDFSKSSYLGEGVDPEIVAAFNDESVQMMRIMRRECDGLKDHGVRAELIRASHGMAGMARLVGFKSLRLAAATVEEWAEHFEGKPNDLSKMSIDAVDEVVLDIERLINAYKTNTEGAELRTGVVEALEKFWQVEAQEHVEVVESIFIQVPDKNDKKPLIAEVVAHLEDEATVESAESVAVDISSEIRTLIQPVALQAAQAPVAVVVQKNSFTHLVDDVQDDVDEELLGAFRPEAEELLAELDDEVSKFSAGSDFKNVNRLIHSLKGGTRMAGMLRLGSILHKMEDATGSSVPLDKKATADLLERIQNTLDYIRSEFENKADSQSAVQQADGQLVGDGAQGQSAGQNSADSFIKVESKKIDSLLVMLGQMRIAQEAIRRKSRSSEELLGESQNPLERLRALSKQIAIEAESKMESGSTATNASAFDALEMDRFSKMHEITRRLAEAVSDVEEIFSQANSSVGSMKHAIETEEDIAGEIDSAISKIGRTPLLAFQGRLRAVARQAANDTKKQVMLDVDGDVRIERAVADMLVPAIEHMIRNSVAHGIEDAAGRAAKGKDPIGKINVHSRNEGRYASVIITDDGAGINFARVHQKSIEKGLISKDHTPTQAELINALFMPGFSTATEVNETAGRGVGLDVVRDTIQRLGGRVSLSSDAGKGARFTIQVPLSSTHVSGLLMSVQGRPYIVPSALVRTVETVSSKVVSSSIKGNRELQLEDGTKSTLIRLHDVCGVRPSERLPSYSTVVAPHDSKYVVFADHVEYVDNAPVRSFDSQNFGKGVLGHSILSDGRVALVINLKEAISVSEGGQSLGDFRMPSIKVKHDKKVLVMVVDDSITVRALSKRFLNKSGFDVMLAINGAEAVEKLMEAKTLPDLILMDIEMPVMDGFEATTTIKATPQIASIPIAFISSRNAEKHRDYAKSIGAAAFFGKPYNEESILDLIRNIVGEEDFKNSAFVESVLEKAA